MTDVLLDTHALLWFDTAPERLTGRVVDLIRDRTRRVHVSAMSAWELAIKCRLGKLPEAEALLKDYHRTLQAYGFSDLPFTSVHALRDRELNHTHKDPFDRALVAQALSEQFVILSKDPAVATFPDVTVVWD
jgi:PIN domain nuclease of toxin-antitoxin system